MEAPTGQHHHGERVRRILDGCLVPRFTPRTTPVADVSYFMVHDWLRHLVVRGPVTNLRSTSSVPTSPTSRLGAAGEELSLAESTSLSGMSLATVRRRWLAGQQLPGAYRTV